MRTPIASVTAVTMLSIPLFAAAPSFLRAGAIKMLTLELGFLFVCSALGVVFALRQAD